MNLLSEIIAAGGPQFLQFFATVPGLLLVLVVVMWIFMIKSKKAQDRKRQELLNQVKKGDRIQTIGGILGTVVEVREQDDEVVVKIDESTNTKMRFVRAAIHRVIADDKEKAQAK